MTGSKTNALRLLEQAGVVFTPHEYSTDDGKTDAVSVAAKLGAPPEQVFKTLVTEAPGKEYFVFIVPGGAELNLKKAARIAGVKSIDLIPSKLLLPLTGYIHGGCSPVGMKKLFPTFLDETAILFDEIYVSGGRVGLNLTLSPGALAGFLQATFGDLTS